MSSSLELPLLLLPVSQNRPLARPYSTSRARGISTSGFRAHALRDVIIIAVKGLITFGQWVSCA